MSRAGKILYLSFGAGAASGVALTVWGFDKWTDTWATQRTKNTSSWNYNWDRSETSNVHSSALLHHSSQQGQPTKSDHSKGFDVNNNMREIESAGENKSRATRHLILIRHGQYDMSGSHDGLRKLTSLGREQADLTGARLQQLAFPFSAIISSTMTRAAETADIIGHHFPDIDVQRCPLIREGAPFPPEPPIRNWAPDKEHFIKDGARIESAFRNYFHRAPPMQEKDSYELLVCHANVIRYFVCRALQFPPEAWLRLNLHNGSITWLSIRPSGRVTLRVMGDSGHIPPEKITSN